MSRSKSYPLLQKPTKNWVLKTGVVSIVFFLVLVLMVWNTSALRRALVHSTEDYARDMSYQLASDISSRFKSYQRSLHLLSNSFSQNSKIEDVPSYLQEQAEILGFDALALVSSEGVTIPSEYAYWDFEKIPGVQSSFQGEHSVTYDEDQCLLFSAPVGTYNAQDWALVGLHHKENVQEVIRPKNFGGHGLTCIIDSRSTVVISPTDSKPFLQLDGIFQSQTDSKTKSALVSMKENLENQRAGTFQFTAVDNRQLILSYQMLGVNDWFLLSLIPADMISGEANTYIFYSFLIVGGIICVSFLFLYGMAQIYRSNQRQLEQIAFTDPLTGGSNLASFQLQYQDLASQMDPNTHTLVYLNVKGFKLINENFGVQEGDNILKHIYHALMSNIRPYELATRANTDQFFLCLREHTLEGVQARLDAMTKAINTFSLYTNIHHYLTLQEGACLIDDPELNIVILQARARAACNHQTQPDICSFYNGEIMQRMNREQELIALFETSLENRDFQVYLQPKVRLCDGKLGGAEALVRWFHPERGMIYPSEFIPLFEKSDRICRLDLYVFEEVCRLLHGWMEDGKQLLPISVNLSRAHFRVPNFLQPFSSLKEKYGIPDGILEIELTESIIFDDQQRGWVNNFIREMHQLGFLCSLDDFGVGYSSLALLKDLDVDTIKLDRRFFEDLDSVKAQNVVASFVELADNLAIHTVAEGIESQDQVDFLRQIHCDMIQGYVFSTPLPIPEFEAWALLHSQEV